MSQFYVGNDDGPAQEEEVFKVIIIGDSNVGKTCLAHRFCTGKFPNRTEATIGVDFWEKRLDVGKGKIKVDVHITSDYSAIPNTIILHLLYS